MQPVVRRDVKVPRRTAAAASTGIRPEGRAIGIPKEDALLRSAGFTPAFVLNVAGARAVVGLRGGIPDRQQREDDEHRFQDRGLAGGHPHRGRPFTDEGPR